MATAAAAMQQSLTSTTAPRRKRIATYGKSRKSPFSFIEDEVSSEKPTAKPNTAGWSSSGLKKVQTTHKPMVGDKNRDAPSAGADVFDIPSSSGDEILQQSPKRVLAKSAAGTRPAKVASSNGTGEKSRKVQDAGSGMYDIPSSSEDGLKSLSRHAPAKTYKPVVTSRFDKMTTTLAKTGDHGAKQSAHSKSTRPAKASASVEGKSSKQPNLPKVSELTSTNRVDGNTGAGALSAKYDMFDVPVSDEDITTRSYAAPRKLSPLMKRTENKAPVAAKKAEYDMFDVPSDEDSPPRRQLAPKPRPKQAPPSKSTAISHPIHTIPSPKQFTESDSSTAAKKRKRYISTSSGGSQGLSNQENAYKDTVPVEHQRSAKHMRREGSAPRDARKIQFSEEVSSRSKPDDIAEAVHKPKRTRTRTEPVTASLSKGQSAPVKLHNMLTVRESRPLRHPSPLPGTSPSPNEDELMDRTEYSELLPSTPSRQTSSPRSPVQNGAVTPRQREIWSNLLGDSSETITPGILKIQDLRISERRHGGTAAKLGRSSSDIPRITRTKRPRLIDSLMKSAPSSDDEDESEEDESENEILEVSVPGFSSTEKRTYGQSTQTLLAEPPDIDSAIEEMDLDPDVGEPSQPSQSAVILPNGLKRTYAQQRSYLNEASLEAELLFSFPMETSPPPGSQRRSLNGNPAFGRAEASDDEEDGQPTNAMRSIHELRKGGEILRFKTDIEALLDDIKDSTSFGKARRRSAMLELATKLCDPTIVHRMIELGLDSQLFPLLVTSEDRIFNFTAAATIALVTKAGVARGVLEHLYQSGAEACLAEMLEHDMDIARIAKERKSNLSKVAQGDVIAFRDVLRDSSLWKDEKPDLISPQLVGLRGLDLLVRGLRKTGNQGELLDDEIVSRLLDIAEGQVENLKVGRTEAKDLKTLKLVLSITEYLSSSGVKAGRIWSSRSLRRVANMMPFFIDNTHPATDAKTEGVKAKLDRLAIRLLINLANSNVRVCEIFSSPALVQPLCGSIDRFFDMLSNADLNEAQSDAVLESLVLTLGAMINLAEYTDSARAAVCETEADEGSALLDQLVMHFLSGTERAAQADSLEASKSNVAYGYLTVLLGNLCLNQEVKRIVVNQLPNRRINTLVNAVNEFIEYNLKVDVEARAMEGAEGREVWSAFTERLRKVVQRLVAG